MRCGPFLILALLAACMPADESSQNAGTPGDAAAATVSVAASEGDGCAMRWNGTAVSADELTGRAVGELERMIEAAGGVEAITEENFLPVRVEAAPATPWRCVGPAMGAAQRAGFDRVLLRPVGAREAPDHVAYLPLPGMDAPNVPIPVPNRIVEIGAAGRMTWDGAPVDMNGLRERVRANTMMSPRGDVIVSPLAEADFNAVYQAVLHINADNEGDRLALASCSGPAGAAGQPGAEGTC